MRSPSPSTSILDVRHVSKTYRRDEHDIVALRDVSFTMDAGSSAAIMGPSGSGKTTLLNVIAGLDRPTSGDVFIAGQRLSDLSSDQATRFRRRHIGFVFQFFNLLPTMTARDNVALPLLAEGLPGAEVDRRTDQALVEVGLGGRADHRPTQLSGGEQQRVAIARALVMRPSLLLADEPTGNLDSVAGDEILGLLRRAAQTYGLCIVMVTHSYLAASATDRILFIRDGRLVEDDDERPREPHRLRALPPRHGEET